MLVGVRAGRLRGAQGSAAGAVVSGIHARGHWLLEPRGVIARVCTGGTAGAVSLCVGGRGYRPPGW